MGIKTRSKCNCTGSSVNRGYIGFMKFLQFFVCWFEMVYETLRNFKRNHYFSKGQLLPPVIKDMDFLTCSFITLTPAASRVQRMGPSSEGNIPVKLLLGSISLTSFHPKRPWIPLAS